VISSSECDVVLFIVLCGVVWFRVLLRCSFVPIERSTSVNQSITNSINDLDVNVADPEAWVFWWFRFDHIICMSLYAINLDVVSMFAVSSFTFLAISMMLLYLMYYINLNGLISFCFCQEKGFIIVLKNTSLFSKEWV